VSSQEFIVSACCHVIRLCLSGILTLAGRLDYEACSQYRLVVADDDTSQLIIVDVLNVNDETPQFSQSVYHVFLSEHCPLHTFVIQLVATDADSCHGN